MMSKIKVKMLSGYGAYVSNDRVAFTPSELKRIPARYYEILPASGGSASDTPVPLAPAKSEAEPPTSEVAALEEPPQSRVVRSPRKKTGSRRSR